MSAFPCFPRITLDWICPSRVVPNLLSGQAALLLANCRHYTAVFIQDCQHGAVLLCEIICSCKDTLNLAVALSLVKGIVCCYIRDESLQHQPATAVFATHFGKINNSCSFPCVSFPVTTQPLSIQESSQCQENHTPWSKDRSHNVCLPLIFCSILQLHSTHSPSPLLIFPIPFVCLITKRNPKVERTLD